MDSDNKSGCGCLITTIAILINLTVGTWSSYEILSWFHKMIPMIGNVVIGLFAGEVTIPVAVVGWILKLCHVF